MRILLSQFRHTDDRLERRTIGSDDALIVQSANAGARSIVPMDVRASIDGIIHSPPGTDVDGLPSEYPNARALVRAGVGYDGLDLEAWGRNGTAVFNVPDYGTSEVADHAIGLMLALTRGVITYNDAIRADPTTGWTQGTAPAVRRLRDAVFGIVGLGRIGLATAIRARSFGMRIAFHDPYLPSGMEIAVGAQRCASLHELIAISDVVSIHAPSSEETCGLVGAEALAHAKSDLVLINTARGSIVDLDALHDALRTRRIMAAGLDVLPTEPADSTHPLIDAWRRGEDWVSGRLILTPHAAFYSPSSVIDMRVKSVKTVLQHLRNGDLSNCVNREFLVRRLA
ncbi:C-terminal binding protein [Microvirga puerhi]|uniref:C-terminal binding protein n=1 Tax=Microvirga puerhi TaxID=2876078 RepID=A0ABS7VTF3_9HYPH|nr:C-terminal binding protein [Microvirga puerhi]MBZ6078459.1 C-terminal binding protein [Microvirga puerhi]